MIGPFIILFKNYFEQSMPKMKILVLEANFLLHYFFPIVSSLCTLTISSSHFFHGLVQLDLLIDPHFWNSVITPLRRKFDTFKCKHQNDKRNGPVFWPDLPYWNQWMDQLEFKVNCDVTLQKLEVYAWWNCSAKRFKICHILYIRKSKVAFSYFHFVLLNVLP